MTDYDYNAVGNLIQTTLPNGAQEVRQYADLNCLVYLENAKANGEIISSYTYDENGNTITYSSLTKQKFYDWNYQNRLISAEVTDASSTRQMQYRRYNLVAI